jgi:23S rRNA (cytidine1920-2'-O)/16S rRNA (cytidine1409-2'-O)-methyltransferase
MHGQLTEALAMTKKSRLDVVLVERGLFASREQARRAIMAGEVKVGTNVMSKASVLVPGDAELTIKTPPRFVGRGGLKLESALDHFGIDPAGAIVLDIGASTGGFTDCLLQRGATKVYAVDVGHGQLAWKIRDDPRVVVHEKLNARFLSARDIPEPVNICVIDVSFISLTLILPKALEFVTPDGVILGLIKPQFELRPADVGRGGVVRDTALHEKAKQSILDFVAREKQFAVVGIVASAITGMDGNQEFFICLRKKSG